MEMFEFSNPTKVAIISVISYFRALKPFYYICSMKNHILAALLILPVLVAACTDTEKAPAGVEVQLQNPIIPGFHPDPSVVAVGLTLKGNGDGFDWGGWHPTALPKRPGRVRRI